MSSYDKKRGRGRLHSHTTHICVSSALSRQNNYHTRSKRAPEERLHGERSLIFGGHITYEEVNSLFDPFDPYGSHPFIKRELKEEIDINDIFEINPVGFLYDKNRDVSSQHLGLVYVVNMTSDRYQIGEKGYHINDEMTKLVEVFENKEKYENWSVELIKYLETKGGARQ